MQKALGVLHPHMQQGESSSKGHIVIGTVEGDLHDIGKNLVVIMDLYPKGKLHYLFLSKRDQTHILENVDIWEGATTA